MNEIPITEFELVRSIDQSVSVGDVAWSPDGTHLATASGDATARIWHTATGNRQRLVGHTGRVFDVAWSPDGTHLATASGDGTARIWDPTTGDQQQRLDGHTAQVIKVAWSPDGTHLATASGDGTARIWDPTTGNEQNRLDGHDAQVIKVAWSPDGTHLATTSGDGTARIWDPTTGIHQHLLDGHTGPVVDVAWSPDGTHLATGSFDGTARIWHTTTGDQQHQLDGHTGPVGDVAWSPDGTHLATTSRDGTRIWRVRRPVPYDLTAESIGGKDTQLELSGHTDIVFAVAWSPDGTHLATASEDGTARIWDTTTGNQQHQLDGHTDRVFRVAWSPDGTHLATASEDGTARIWDTTTGIQQHLLDGHTGRVFKVAWSPDGTHLATAGEDGTARIWDTTTGNQQQRFVGHTGRVLDVAWSPDGIQLATASEDGTARIWDTTTGNQQHQLDGHTGLVVDVAWSPDGIHLATASFDGTARIWHTTTGNQQHQLDRHTDRVLDVAWSPDGSHLATASEDGTARIWDTTTGNQQHQLDGHTDRVLDVAWSPDGTHLAIACQRETARIVRLFVLVDVGRARYSPDGGRGQDLLGLEADVSVLAGMVTAKSTPPPLAIGLFADWGGGKSHFMRLLAAKIADISASSSTWACHDVRQVRFNAWHYAEAELWPSLATELFSQIAEANPSWWTDETHESPYLNAGEAQRLEEDAESLLRYEASLQRLVDGFEKRPSLGIAPRWSMPLGAERADASARRAQIGRSLIGEHMRRLLSWTRNHGHIGDVAVASLLGMVLVGGILGASYGGLIARVISAFAFTSAAIGTVWRFGARIRAGIRTDALPAELRATTPGNVKVQLRVVRSLRLATQGRLGDHGGTEAVSLATRRDANDSYRQLLGHMTDLRTDFERLSTLLQAKGSDRIPGVPSVDRVVVYVDDLDRCPHGRVVQVLEAVNLLLAIDLFVVVVAVDPRWLLTSLQVHYEKILSSANPDDSSPHAADETVAWASTPMNYLEKIFQVPFTLHGMTNDQFRDYLINLTTEASNGEGIGSEIETITNPTPDVSTEHPEAESEPAQPQDANGNFLFATVANMATGEADGQPLQNDQPSEPEQQPEQDPQRPTPPSPEGDKPLGTRTISSAVRLSAAERDCLALLGPPAVNNPRAAKRLINTYQLLRARHPDDLPSDGEVHHYRAVAILLGAMIGYPTAALDLFRQIEAAAREDPTRTWTQFLADFSAQSEARNHTELSRWLSHLTTKADELDVPLPEQLNQWRAWLMEVGRFSFLVGRWAARLPSERAFDTEF